VLSASEHLPDAERRHRRRQALQEASKLDPEDLATAVEATQFLVEDGKHAAAYRALEALAQKSEHPYIAVRAAHRLATTENWDTEVSRGLERMRALCPTAAWPLRDLAAHYDLLGNAGRAYDLYEASLDMNAASIEALTNLAGLERKAGRYDQAEARLRAALEAWPEHDGLVRSLSRVLEESGNGEGAANLLEETQAYAWRSSPFDRLRVGDACLLAAAHKEREGALEAATTLGARARRAYEEALEFMPARFDLRNHLHAVSSDPKQDQSAEATLLAYVTGLRIDAEEALEGAPEATEFPKAHSVGVLDHMVTWVHEDGTQTEWVHQLHEIRDSKGVQQHHTTQVGGEILRLRTLAIDGKVYEPLVTNSTRDIILPKLEPGARIEVEYRMERRRKPAFQMDLGPFFFRDPELTTPYWQSRWDLVVPKGLDVRWVERNMVEADALHEETELAGGYVHHRYETRRMDRFEPEAFMPTRDELTPWVRVLGERTLNDVAEVLSERFAGRAKLTPQLEQAAADAVASAASPTQLEQAKALFAFVQSHVKTSQGRAFRASEILAEGTGSRTILLKALLDAAGIPNRYGFARRHPSLAPPVVWSPPRPELFDVPLLAIEPQGAERVFFFDLGRYVPFGHMPYALGGGSGLLLSQEGGELITLPAVPLSGEGQLTRTALTLAKEGATVRVDTIVKNGYGAKENLETVPKDMVKLSLEQQAASLFFQPKITEVDLPGLTDVGKPLHLRYTAQVPRAVEPAGEGAFELKLPFQPLQLSRQLLGPSEREHPLVLRAAQLQEDEVSIDLGPYAMAGVPGDVLVRGEFGFYTLLFRAEAETLHITRRFVIEPSQIAPQDYAALRDQLQTIDAAERARIRLRRR
ncbi:MAG: tetratricopeptide repeat protein, partial [Planctomycetota bacterium]